jgi:hypothetical protein
LSVKPVAKLYDPGQGFGPSDLLGVSHVIVVSSLAVDVGKAISLFIIFLFF